MQKSIFEVKHNIKKCENWYQKSYKKFGLKAQRRYPNEEFIRFLGRDFGGIAIKNRNNIKVLELGCGSCANLWMVAKEGFDAYGIDLSQQAIELGKIMLNNWNVKADLKVGNITNLPYPDNSMDVICDIFSSYCLCVEDFYKCVREICRVLKEGGRFFSYSPSTNSGAFKNYKPAKKIDKFTLNGIKRKNSPYYGNNYTFRFISPKDYNKMLEGTGLKVEYLEVISKSYNHMKEIFEFVTIVGKK